MNNFTATYINIYNVKKYIKTDEVNMFGKVYNKQFIEKLRAIFIIDKTLLHTPTDCFTLWRDHQGDLNLTHRKTLKSLGPPDDPSKR